MRRGRRRRVTERRRRDRASEGEGRLLQLEQHERASEGHVQLCSGRSADCADGAKQIDQFIAGVAAEIDDRADDGRLDGRRAITWLSRIKSHLIPFHASRRWSFERRKLPRDPLSPPSSNLCLAACASARPTLSEKQITQCFSASQRATGRMDGEGGG